MNTEQERLQILMQKEELNAKDFAQEVGISAATMSNILGGRNKPSLEVMQKVLNRFRMVNSDWLILGVGSVYKSKQDAQEQTLFDVKPQAPAVVAPTDDLLGEIVTDVPAQQPAARPAAKSTNAVQVIERTVNKRVTKVVIFFEDGTFQEL